MNAIISWFTRHLTSSRDTETKLLLAELQRSLVQHRLASIDIEAKIRAIKGKIEYLENE